MLCNGGPPGAIRTKLVISQSRWVCEGTATAMQQKWLSSSVALHLFSVLLHVSQWYCMTARSRKAERVLKCSKVAPATNLLQCPLWAMSAHSHASQHFRGDFAGIRNAVAETLHIGFALPSLCCRCLYGRTYYQNTWYLDSTATLLRMHSKCSAKALR